MTAGSQGEWREIASAPDLERVFVAGWQPRHGNMGGYWWWHEDVVVDGAATEHPDATLWYPIALPPLPTPPVEAR